MLLRRAAADRTVLVMAAVPLALAAVTVALVWLLVVSATDGTVASVLSRSDVADRAVVVTTDLDDVTDLEAADDLVSAEVTKALDPAPAEVLRRSESTAYSLPGRPRGSSPRLTVLATYEALAERATLTAGTWPTAGGDGPLPVALPDRAAEALGVTPGSTLRIVNRLDDSSLQVRVVGTFTPLDPAGPGWIGDELGRRGVVEGSSFTTYGPLVTDPSALEDTADPALFWVGQPDLSGFDAAASAATARSVRELQETGTSRFGEALGSAVEVESGLDDVLASVAVPVRVGMTGVAMPGLLVTLLAVGTLLLVGGLLGNHRASGRSLRRARGASQTGLMAGDLAEAVVLALPVALVSPWLALAVSRGVDALTGADGPPATLDPSIWLVSGVVGFLGALALVIGAAAGSRLRRRPGRRGRLLWFVVEVGAVVLGVGAVLQLVRYREDSGSESANDTLIVLAPAFVLVATGLVVARLLPLVARWGDVLVRRERGASASLGAWQLSRRAGEQHTAVVLLLAAAAVTAFGAVHLASWSQSQDEQAALAVGGDVRVGGLEGDGRDVAELLADQGATVVDVRRLPATLGGERVEALALDGDAAGVLGTALPSGPGPLADPAFGSTDRDEVAGVVAGSLGRGIDTSAGLRVEVSGADVRVRVVGTLDEMPGATDPSAGGLLLADGGLAEAVPDLEEEPPEVWAALSQDRWSAVRDRVTELEPQATVTDRWSRAAQARSGPVGVGTRAATSLAIGGAVLFIGIAFLTATGIGLRGRRTELAALRALGLSSRQVAVSVVWERVGLLALTLLAGGAAGGVAGWLLVPLLVRTSAGATPVPPVDPTVPWLPVVLGVLLLVGVAVAAVALLLTRTRGAALGGQLRTEDT